MVPRDHAFCFEEMDSRLEVLHCSNKNPAKDFCWWDLDGVCLSVVVVVVVQW